jgi:hypothetical protein
VRHRDECKNVTRLTMENVSSYTNMKNQDNFATPYDAGGSHTLDAFCLCVADELGIAMS